LYVSACGDLVMMVTPDLLSEEWVRGAPEVQVRPEEV